MDLIEMIIYVALCLGFYAWGASKGNAITKEYEEITGKAIDVIKKQQEIIDDMLEERKKFLLEN